MIQSTEEGLTPEAKSAREQLTVALADPAHPALNPTDPRHAEASAELKRLHAAAYLEPMAEHGGPPPGEAEEGETPADLPTLPEGFQWEATDMAEFRVLAEELAVPPAAQARVLEWEAACCAQGPPDQQKTVAALRAEWGESFEQTARAIRWFMETRVPRSLHAALERNGLGNHPGMVRLVANVAVPEFARAFPQLSRGPQAAPLEHEKRPWSSRRFRFRGARETTSQPTAQEQIASIRADTRHPYHHPGDRRHGEAVSQMEQLYQRVYGTRPVG